MKAKKQHHGDCTDRIYPPRALDAQASAFISAVTLIGALSYLFVVGDIKRIMLPGGADAASSSSH